MVAVTPTNLQKMEFDVTTAEGPSRVTVITGVIPEGPNVNNPQSGSGFLTQTLTLTALVDPTLTPGQFRKATATAALAATFHQYNGVGGPGWQFSIDNVEASLDDESGRIELRIEASVGTDGGNASIRRIAFQVTTLAKL
jgi:hypothetical protein